MKSMTGFGRGEAAIASGGRATVEIAGVNRKQFELRCNLPRELATLEPEIKRIVNGRIGRGSVTLRVAIDQTPPGVLQTPCMLNEAALAVLAAGCMAVREKLQEPDLHISLSELAAIPGVVMQNDPETESEETVRAVMTALAAALDSFEAMRTAEGGAMRRDLDSHLARLKELAGQIRPLCAALPGAIRKKLLDKLTAENLPIDLGDERLLKELLFYADKADVSEELARLDSHFAQMDKFFSDPAAGGGRSMDFLIQEFFREITTLGNKCQLAEVSILTVEFKSILEKMREQIQNVE